MGLIHLPFHYHLAGTEEAGRDEEEGAPSREGEAVSVSCNKALREALGREFSVGVRREMGGGGKRAEVRWDGLC